MRVRSDVELGNLTDPGCERSENQDYYCYLEPEDEGEFHRKGRLLAVADGMGGHAGGQVASALAVEALRASFEDGAGHDPFNLLLQGFQNAQRSILAHAKAHPELDGMGTTCTAAILHQGSLIYGHIGDSRLYLWHDEQFRQITEDHTMVNQLLKRGDLSEERAATHEHRNVLTAALGMKTANVSAEFSREPVALAPGDFIVLTSDGLHGLVTTEEIRDVAASQTANNACQTLVAFAKERGGPDNITVQILRLWGEPPST